MHDKAAAAALTKGNTEGTTRDAATDTATGAGSGAVAATINADESDPVFNSAAELFRLLATPIRLKIISALCGHEKNVSQLLGEIATTQPNMSQHLATLHRAGVLARRRDATQVYYRIGSQRAATLCRAVCMQIALEADAEVVQPDSERLTPTAERLPPASERLPPRTTKR